MILSDESLAAFREAKDAWGVAVVSGNAGYMALAEGDCARATVMLEEALRASQELGDEDAVGRALHNLGLVALVQEERGKAAGLLTQSLRLTRHNKRNVVSCIVGVAALAADLGEREQASTLVGSVEAWLTTTGGSLERFERILHERTSAAVRNLLDEKTFSAAWEAGRAMTVEQAADYAIATACAARNLVVEADRPLS